MTCLCISSNASHEPSTTHTDHNHLWKDNGKCRIDRFNDKNREIQDIQKTWQPLETENSHLNIGQLVQNLQAQGALGFHDGGDGDVHGEGDGGDGEDGEDDGDDDESGDEKDTYLSSHNVGITIRWNVLNPPFLSWHLSEEW